MHEITELIIDIIGCLGLGYLMTNITFAFLAFLTKFIVEILEAKPYLRRTTNSVKINELKDIILFISDHTYGEIFKGCFILTTGSLELYLKDIRQVFKSRT